jgi:hypothetical protein
MLTDPPLPPSPLFSYPSLPPSQRASANQGERSVLRQHCAEMVVRSAQKELGDVQRIREAMEANRPVVTTSQRELIFLYNVFTESTGKIHCRYEAPREEPREAHGYLALDCEGYMVALSVNVNVTLWESVKES